MTSNKRGPKKGAKHVMEVSVVPFDQEVRPFRVDVPLPNKSECAWALAQAFVDLLLESLPKQSITYRLVRKELEANETTDALDGGSTADGIGRVYRRIDGV
jgi:hypothetical protein